MTLLSWHFLADISTAPSEFLCDLKGTNKSFVCPSVTSNTSTNLYSVRKQSLSNVHINLPVSHCKIWRINLSSACYCLCNGTLLLTVLYPIPWAWKYITSGDRLWSFHYKMCLIFASQCKFILCVSFLIMKDKTSPSLRQDILIKETPNTVSGYLDI